MDAVSPHLVFIKDRVYRLNKEKKYSHGTESNFNGIESSKYYIDRLLYKHTLFMIFYNLYLYL